MISGCEIINLRGTYKVQSYRYTFTYTSLHVNTCIFIIESITSKRS